MRRPSPGCVTLWARESSVDRAELGGRERPQLRLQIADVAGIARFFEQLVDDGQEKVQRPDPWQRVTRAKRPPGDRHHHGSLDHAEQDASLEQRPRTSPVVPRRHAGCPGQRDVAAEHSLDVAALVDLRLGPPRAALGQAARRRGRAAHTRCIFATGVRGLPASRAVRVRSIRGRRIASAVPRRSRAGPKQLHLDAPYHLPQDPRQELHASRVAVHADPSGAGDGALSPQACAGIAAPPLDRALDSPARGSALRSSAAPGSP